MGALSSAGRGLRQLFSSHRRLWLPFLATATLEALFLGILWLAAHPPLATLLAPPLEAVFGPNVLHYPWHLGFLYATLPYTHALTGLLLGGYLTGVACAMVGQGYAGQPLSLREALVGFGARYGTMTCLWAIGAVVPLGAAALAGRWTAGWPALFAAALVARTLLVYAVPAAVAERTGWWRALRRSVRETLLHPFSTLVVVAVPSALLAAFADRLAPGLVWPWMLETSPDRLGWLMAGRLLLWTVAEAGLTVAVAHLWWARRALATAPARQAAPSSRRPGGLPAVSLVGAGALVCLGISLLGCSAGYQGERLFWKAQRLSRPILEQAAEADGAAYDQAAEALARVTRAAPDTIWAARAYFETGRLREQQAAYDAARAAYEQVLVNYRRHTDLCISAYLRIAKTHQVQEHWEEVIETFQALSETFRWSNPGLEAPLWIGELYESLGQHERAVQAYDRAALWYTRWIPEAPSPERVGRIRRHLVSVYQRLGRWDRAVSVLEALIRQPDGIEDRATALLTLATLYQTKLENPEKSRAVYETILKEFPDQPISQEATLRLQELGLLHHPVTPSPLR